MPCKAQWWLVFGCSLALGATSLICIFRWVHRKGCAPWMDWQARTVESKPHSAFEEFGGEIAEEKELATVFPFNLKQLAIAQNPEVQIQIEDPNCFLLKETADFEAERPKVTLRPRCPEPAKDPYARFLGTWVHGGMEHCYHLSRVQGRLDGVLRGPRDGGAPQHRAPLRYREQLASGEWVWGLMRLEDNRLQGKVFRGNGRGNSQSGELGVLRFTWVEELGCLRSNFRERWRTDWGPDVLASPMASRDVPRVLRVSSPMVQQSCDGVFELVQVESDGCYPLWKKVDCNRWLYSGTDGRWYIGGKLSWESGFECAAGYIFCVEPHGGTLPHGLSPGAWAWGDGSTWHSEASIEVTAVHGGDDANYKTVVWREGDDVPGTYLITHDRAAVTAELSMSSPCIIAQLSYGTIVNVVEVVHLPEEKRVRACIEEPPGWISLVNTEDGYRWAKEVEASCESALYTLHPKCQHALAEIGEADIELSDMPGVLSLKGSLDLEEASTQEGSLPSFHSDVQSLFGPSLEVGSSASCQPPPVQVAVPRLLRVSSPNGQQECNGLYRLRDGLQPDEQPLWDQLGGGGRSVSSRNGTWCIGGKGPRDAACWLHQQQPHGDALPHESPACWRRWNGRAFEDDRDVAVALAALPAHPAGAPQPPGALCNEQLAGRPADDRCCGRTPPDQEPAPQTHQQGVWV